MHIPSSMLQGAICPVTLTAAGLGIGLTFKAASKINNKPSSARFAAVTALIFSMQMLNYPVQNGTSGHLVGAMIAVSLLKIPFAILSMSIVLAVQAFFFGDGGINALGANIINMGLIGAGLIGILLNKINEVGLNKKISLAIASLLSVLVGAVACSFEVAISGTVALNKVLPAMTSIHLLIGIGEALLTVAVVTVLQRSKFIWKRNEQAVSLGAGVLAIIAASLSPLASSFPDGLEWVAEKLSFAQFSAFEMSVIFPDYQAAFISNSSLATITAGIIGLFIVFGLTFAAGNILNNIKS